MDKDLLEFLKITQRINSQLPIDDGELEFYTKFAGQMNDQKLNEITAKLDQLKKEGKVDPNLSTQSLVESYKNIVQQPHYREMLLNKVQQAKEGKLSQAVANGLNTLLAGTDIATSAQQIAQSKQALARNRRPGRPGIPGRDPYLQQALKNLQEGNYGVSQTLAPARAEINDNYLSDLQNARTAAAGQAGSFGSYAQVASNRRNKAALGLGALANDVRQQNIGNYNNLLGMRMNETQNMFDNQSHLYGQDLNQYNNELQYAGQIGAAGRANLRDSLTGLGQSLTPMVSSYVTSRKFRPLYENLRSINPQMADKVQSSLNYAESSQYPNANPYPGLNRRFLD